MIGRENVVKVKSIAEGTSAAATQVMGVLSAQRDTIESFILLPTGSISSGVGMTAIIDLWVIKEGVGDDELKLRC